MEEAYILSAVRTRLSKFGDVLADLSSVVIERCVKPVFCLSTCDRGLGNNSFNPESLSF